MRKLTVIVIAALAGAMFPTAGLTQNFEAGFSAYNSGDYETALRVFRPLAEQGNAAAQFTLGFMYSNGEGVPENDVEAVRWYRMAAKQGDADAQYNVGVMYAEGQGVPENYATAYIWWDLAAEQGNERAKHNKGILLGLMTPADISRAQQLSQACLARNYKGC